MANPQDLFGVLFGWFAYKIDCLFRFLVYLVVQSYTRAIYFPKRTPMHRTTLMPTICDPWKMLLPDVFASLSGAELTAAA